MCHSRYITFDCVFFQVSHWQSQECILIVSGFPCCLKWCLSVVSPVSPLLTVLASGNPSCFTASHWWLCAIMCVSWYLVNGAVLFQVSRISLMAWVLLILGVPLLLTEVVLCCFKGSLSLTGVTVYCPRLPTAHWHGFVVFQIYHFLSLELCHIVA